jgi:HSP20 family protein
MFVQAVPPSTRRLCCGYRREATPVASAHGDLHMHETATKEQDQKTRRTNPIHIVEGSRMGASHADVLRDAHLSLVRAEQNLYNLVQASNGANGAAFGYPAQQPFAASYPPGFAPGFAPGFGPGAAVPAPAGLAFGMPAAPWAAHAANPWAPQLTAPWASPATAIPAWNPLAGAIGASPLAPPAFVPATAIAAAVGRIPALDVSDEGKQFVCQVDLPGLRAEQVELLCSERTVLVSAYREAEVDAASLVQSERGTATLQRTITLPTEILPSGAKATLSNGVLTVVLPKANPTEGPRRVKVQG